MLSIVPSWLLILTLLILGLNANAQITDLNVISTTTHEILQEEFEEGSFVGAIATIVTSDSVVLNQGYGTIAVESQQKVEPETSLFQVGSVGKILTSLLILNLVREGQLSLDDPVQSYISAPINQRIENSPITLRDLLSHTAGLNDHVIGYAARTAEEREPIGYHLQERMPGPYTEPGAEISYSNYSYGLAGYIAQRATGGEFTSLVKTRLLDPLEMYASGYAGFDQYSSRFEEGHSVKGYSYNKQYHFWEETPNIFSNPVAAGSLFTTGKDMATFLQYLLTDKLHSELFEPQYENLPGLSTYSLGFEVWERGGIRILSKGGSVPGFNSVILMAPKKDLACFISVNTSSDRINEIIIESILDNLGIISRPSTDHLQIDRETDEFEGDYRLNRLNRNSIEEFFGQVRGTFKVWSRGDTLLCFHENKIQKYLPIGSSTFANVHDDERLLIFEEDEQGKIYRLNRDGNISGAYLPETLERIPWYDSNAFLNEWFGLFVIGAVMFVLYPLIWMVRMLIRTSKSGKIKSLDISNWLSTVFGIISVIWVIKYFIPLLSVGDDILFGIPSALNSYSRLPFLLVAIFLLTLTTFLSSIRNRTGSKVAYLFLFFHLISALVFLLVLNRWHFIEI